MMVQALIWLALLVASERVPVAADVELHVVESGSGPALVFVPGWTMTTEFFEPQLEAFADSYRVLTFDPRSHGASTKTATGNTYEQHGRDLAVLLDRLELRDVVLVGWSSGCHDVLAYVRARGVERLRGVVLIDEPPKAVGDASKEWVYGSFEGYRSTFESTLHARRDSAEGLARWMVERELTSDEIDWIVEESLKTPDEAALTLMVDTTLLDFVPEAKRLDGAVPVLYMLREDWGQAPVRWLRENTPAAKVARLGSHAEHWEKPAVFNAKLEEFLETLPPWSAEAPE
ncbi:MAG: alpha/beta hydrolase [Acidobacteriota bacterium]